MTRWLLRHLLAEIDAAATLLWYRFGYWVRPFDMLADRRRWRLQARTPCGFGTIVRPVATPSQPVCSECGKRRSDDPEAEEGISGMCLRCLFGPLPGACICPASSMFNGPSPDCDAHGGAR